MLQKSDEIVVVDMNRRIVTGIKALLLLPHEAQEMHVRGEYNRMAEVCVSVGVCIAALEDLSSAVVGAPMFIVDRKLKGSTDAQKRWEEVDQIKILTELLQMNFRCGACFFWTRGVLKHQDTMYILLKLRTSIFVK